ncbi:MAG: endonuclease [Gemmataceae bacterium]
MPATSNKQRTLNAVFSTLPKHTDGPVGINSKADSRPVLEQFIYAICREGNSRVVADRAYTSLCESFFDWNEIRVSSTREIADALVDLSQPDVRAQRIIDFLQQVFEITFSFDLEYLKKKGLKIAAEKLTRIQASNDFCVAWVLQQSLGGHAVPLDETGVRVLSRLGLIEDPTVAPDTVRSSVEHLVPKAKGPIFTDLVGYLAEDYCWEVDPQCQQCPLASVCAKAMESKPEAVGAGKGG